MRQPDFDTDAIQAVANRVLPGSGHPRVERMRSGGSTAVYRIERGDVRHYLRLAETPEDDLSPDMLVHNLLVARGVKVPDVIHFEAFNPSLGRGLMVTTEIAGKPLRDDHQGVDLAAVLRSAGRDLAVINGIEVDGFGWVRRDRPNATHLEGVLPSLHRFVFDESDAHFAAIAVFFSSDEIALIHRAIRLWDSLLDADHGLLAHGDFDPTHIYHRDGVYTGIIDFGEIRGTDRFYDLGHFALHDGEHLPEMVLPHLVAGYGEVVSLPPDHKERVHLWCLLIGVRALARSIGRADVAPYQRYLIQAIKRAVVALP